MKMTIDEIIAKETKIAQEFQAVIDTHITMDNFSLEELYCDDTEVIEEHLQTYKVFADYHNQIANIMRKYQIIKEIVKNSNGLLDGTLDSTLEHDKAFVKICEVLDDGNDSK